MPAVLRHNETLELNLVEYQGGVTLAELKAMAAFMARNPQCMRRDTLNIVHPGAHFSAIPTAELDGLFAYYAKLFEPLNLQIMRRAAWVCRSKAAEPAMRHWLRGDMRAHMASTVRAFDTMEEAADWLLLSAAELALVERADSFADIARFTAPAPAR